MCVCARFLVFYLIFGSWHRWQIEVRDTARIPIVLVVDPETGLHVDVSASNALAVRNTRLLRMYANIDMRVRVLAYIIKAWSVSVASIALCSAACACM
mgnify:CR=1 FL=1